MMDEEAEPGERELSHDPRTWGAGPKDEPAAKAGSPLPGAAGRHEEPSLDVASWVKPRAGGAARPPPPPPSGKLSPLLIGAGAAGVVLLLGIGAMVASRPKAPTYESASAPAQAGPAPTLESSQEHQVLTLEGLGGLQASLVTLGAPAPQAEAAAAAAREALGAKADALRMEAVIARTASARSLSSLTLQRPDGSGVTLTASADAAGFKPELLAADAKTELKLVKGQMDAESFYSSAVAAGVSDVLIPEFAQAFAFDFDFQREIHPGDVFEAGYEEAVNGRGQSVGPKRLLYASLSTAAKSRALYRFTPPGETEAGWFDGAGRSNKKGLMRTPVEGARISSSFGWRTHPILGFQKLHKGTDFAAPIGTPIYASGDAVVEWAAMKGFNGNLTILKHDNGWETYYLHQSKFDDGITPGARVRQGQEIGLVGTTGRSTGPHLHYELHINGEAVDAMAQALDEGKKLDGAALKAFESERDRIDKLRAAGI